MSCEKKKHPLATMLAVTVALGAAVGGMMLFITKTKKGRRIARRARRIGREVEELVANEFHFM